MFDIGRKLIAALSYFGSTDLADEDGVYVVRNLTRVAVAFIALSFAAGCDPSSVQDRIGVEHLRSGGYRILICPQDLVDGVGVQGPQDFNDPPGPSPFYWRIRISPPRRIYQIRLGGRVLNSRVVRDNPVPTDRRVGFVLNPGSRRFNEFGHTVQLDSIPPGRVSRGVGLVRPNDFYNSTCRPT